MTSKPSAFFPWNSDRIDFLSRSLRNRAVTLSDGMQSNLGPLSLHCVPATHGGWRYLWQKGFSSN